MRRGEDLYWRGSRIAARILLRSKVGRLRPRDRRWAARLAAEPGVTDRLIEQALASLRAKENGPLSSRPPLGA